MTDDDDELWQAALHEAGHAVAAYLMGCEFTSVSIESNPPIPDQPGQVSSVKCWHDIGERADKTHDKVFIEQEIIVLLAGHAAEDDGLWWQETQDVHRAMTLAWVLFGTKEKLDKFLGRMAEQTESLVNQNWRAIISVARRLTKRKTITQDEAIGIITRTSKRKSEPSK